MQRAKALMTRYVELFTAPLELCDEPWAAGRSETNESQRKMTSGWKSSIDIFFNQGCRIWKYVLIIMDIAKKIRK